MQLKKAPTTSIQQFVASTFFVVWGALLLQLIGFYNGYPLVYSDTGTYIYSGFRVFVPDDRPILYGLFIRFFSVKQSLWLVIFVQNLIASFVLYAITEKVVKRYLHGIFLGVVGLLTATTAVGWTTNELIPDFLAPICIFIFFLLVSKNEHSRLKTAAFVGIMILSCVSHFSHLLLFTALFGCLIVYQIAFDNISAYALPKNLRTIFLTLLLCWILIPTINYAVEQKFILNKGSHVFLMAHFNDTGILNQFLEENCNKQEYQKLKLCALKDEIPPSLAGFIWTKSFIDKVGGWQDSKEEFDFIIHELITTPKYATQSIFDSFRYGLIQLTKNEMGNGLTPEREGSAPYGQISWRFPDELNAYKNSKQNSESGLTSLFSTLNRIQFYVLIFAGLSLLYRLRKINSWDKNVQSLLLISILGVLFNAFITAGLNAPTNRFQARVVWIVVFVSSIINLYLLQKKNLALGDE